MHNACRTCLCDLTDRNFINIEEDSTIKDQLEYCVPEMAPNVVIINPVMCLSCTTALHSMYEFKHQCLQTDERIRHIVQNKMVELIAVNLFEAFYGAGGSGHESQTPRQVLVEDESIEVQNVLSNIKQEWQEENEISQVVFAEDYEVKLDELKTECDTELPDIKNIILPVKTEVEAPEDNEPSADMCDGSDTIDTDDFKLFHDVKIIPTDLEPIRDSNENITEASKVRKRNRGNKTWKCGICHYTTQIKVNMKRHLEWHTGEKPFQCDKCGFKTSRKDNLILHITANHSNRKVLFNCNVCNYQSTLKKNLKRHVMYNHVEKKRVLICDKCGYKTAHKNNLKVHLIKHTQEMPYHCEHCDFATADKTWLSRHMMIHTGQKPYVCDKCNYKTSQKHHLNRHLASHTVCSICNYLTTKKSIKKHIMTMHTENIKVEVTDA